MSANTQLANILTQGYAHFPQACAAPLVAALCDEMERAFPYYAEKQRECGYTGTNDGGLHHVLCVGGAFLDLIQSLPASETIAEYFASKFIINSCGAFCSTANTAFYSNNVHRDIRTFSQGVPLMLNMIVMLDDFTPDNGATFLLPKSHTRAERPEDAYFYGNSVRALGKSGDVVLFDSNLWHAGGRNTSSSQRRAVTLTLSRPYLKQQFDYATALGLENVAQMTDIQKQLLGYFARTPASLNEWYQPAESRMYRAGQG